MRPAFLALGLWCLGILLPLEASWPACALALAGLVLAWRGGEHLRPAFRWGVAATSLVVLSLGWTQLRTPSEAPDDAALLAPMRWLVVSGRVSTEPIPSASGSRFEFAPDALEAPYPRRLGGRILVRLAGPERPRLGERLRLEGGLHLPEAPANPGEGSYREALARRGLFATLAARRFERLEPAPPSVAGLAIVLKHSALSVLGAHLPQSEAALLGSLLLGGGASPIDPDAAGRFRDVGLAHVLAASGAQVLIVLGALKGLAGVLRLPRRLAVVLVGAGILLYGLMTGMPPSITRAVLMAGANLLAWGARRRGRRLAPLIVAVWAMLLHTPAVLLDLGFLFSALATYALLDTAPLLQERLRRLPPVVAETLASSVAALLWVTPLQLAVFGQASAWALPANLLAMGFVLVLTQAGAVLVPVAAAAHALGLAGPWLDLPFRLLSLLLAAFLRTVEGLHALPGASLYLVPLGGLAGAGLYLLLAWGLRCARQGRLRRLGLATLLAIALVLGRGLPRAGELEVTVLSVGQGDAIAIQTPRGRWYLIDAGPAWEGGDAGARVVVPFLRRRGATRLAGLVVTHPHLDHLGGAASILEAMPCEAVLENGQASDERAHDALFAAMLRHRVPWRPARAGETLCLEPGLFLDVMGPFSPPHAGTRSDANNNSVVLRLRYGTFRMLLVGDVEHEAERRLVREHGAWLSATVLKAAHHGSRYGSGETFLEAVSPRASIVSVGSRNTFRHPAPETLARLRRHGPVYRTDHDGAVTVRTDGRRHRIEAFRAPHGRGARILTDPGPG